VAGQPLNPPRPWRLRRLRVCASTEWELERWLAQRAEGAAVRLDRPWVVVAHHQRHGHGQFGRAWQSPPGGVWLSAALPWAAELSLAAPPGLTVAVALLRQLEAMGLEVRLKWPNDLLAPVKAGQWRKLAGCLSGLRLRGSQVRWARLGLGLNGCNPVPPEATHLKRLIGPVRARPRRLFPIVWRSLDWAMAHAGEPELIRREAQARLWLPDQPLWVNGEPWAVEGLTLEGGLALAREDGRRTVLHRTWPDGSGSPYIGAEAVRGP
jgi:BirA family biotin operon repressor/biotin-[acetyl-CoA-carboxylase] ligase